MYSHLDADDASTLVGLQQSLATYEPQLAAIVVRNLLRWLREAGVGPIDRVPKDEEHPQTEEVVHALCHIPCLQPSLTAHVPCLRDASQVSTKKRTRTPISSDAARIIDAHLSEYRALRSTGGRAALVERIKAALVAPIEGAEMLTELVIEGRLANQMKKANKKYRNS